MLNLSQLKQDLKALLSQREPKRIEDNVDTYTQASVLLPLFIKDGHFWLLLMRRANTVEYHKGEVSFPGGVVDERDYNLESTAKRETFEEIGVREEDIEILGQLDDMTTITSRFIIHPFVGTVPFPYEFTINKTEVERLIEVPLQFFLDPSQPQPFLMNYKGDTFETPAFIYEGIVVWGATERILENFVGVIRPAYQSY
ncbi:MAG: CoA pyrophosphatase [Deltaproteobacteria bacterium]|nr:CoA pyrophosphatase [Deltaproteobacteria bacterium]HDH87832.1 CoA pyrophosphatase [Desulfobacteraceae bacterium]MBW2104673.1 CoA pyrophosphatase [Deltaproteobacteria bacterium]MBW2332458.1 CoA pyrophosphatase [Deltaproteobacteria bacterium]MCD6265595.1 CoA pyrophosphatase [Deltaproteobacteria bacterium]